VKEALEGITTEAQREKFYDEYELDFAYSVRGLARFRANAFYQRGTISIAIRQVPFQPPTIDELGLPQICKAMALKQKGLVLVTGPTGTGKSTTLASMINHLNRTEARNIITIEDPIEFLHQNDKCIIAQRDLGDDTKAFGTALRHALRQDPDVIFVGEMRDLDTISTAITAAETGHLVLSTVHTVSAPQTIERIVDVFPPHQQQQIRFQLSLVMEGILSQTLLPRRSGKGRVAAFEIMLGTEAIRNLIRDCRTEQIPSYLQTGSQLGMQTMDQSLEDLVRTGAISMQEALSRHSKPDDLRRVQVAEDPTKYLFRV
jgi:twitching motility protein PilT